MQIIHGEGISKLVDYSFGDHFALWDTTLPNAFFKAANAHNLDFLMKAQEFEGKVMTLFIDNLRLYPRPVKTDTEHDTKFVSYLMNTNNLLALCALLPYNQFVIYTSQEDTPIDENIRVPFNVLQIFGVNALYNDDRITPFPFGLQRQMNADDKRLEIILENLDKSVEPKKLLYLNMGIGRNPEREPLKKFETNDWVTTRFDEQSKFFPYSKYQDFLDELRDHKFIACPPGHGMDTHRIWETLYMKRVPIVKRHPYFEKLLEGFPVLWVDNWDITKDLLEKNDNLYKKALKIDLDKLDLEKIMNEHKEKYARLQ